MESADRPLSRLGLTFVIEQRGIATECPYSSAWGIAAESHCSFDIRLLLPHRVAEQDTTKRTTHYEGYLLVTECWVKSPLRGNTTDNPCDPNKAERASSFERSLQAS